MLCYVMQCIRGRVVEWLWYMRARISWYGAFSVSLISVQKMTLKRSRHIFSQCTSLLAQLAFVPFPLASSTGKHKNHKKLWRTKKVALPAEQRNSVSQIKKLIRDLQQSSLIPVGDDLKQQVKRFISQELSAEMLWPYSALQQAKCGWGTFGKVFLAQRLHESGDKGPGWQ